MNRRGFLRLLGIAAPAAVVAPKIAEAKAGCYVIPPDVWRTPTTMQELAQSQPVTVPTMRYLGMAALKNEGNQNLAFDTAEIGEFAREAFGRKELYQWPDSDWEDEA